MRDVVDCNASLIDTMVVYSSDLNSLKKALLASFRGGSKDLEGIGRDLPDECFMLNSESMICISKVE